MRESLAIAPLDAAAIHIVLAAVLGYLNHRHLRLQQSVGLTVMRAVAPAAVIGIGHTLRLLARAALLLFVCASGAAFAAEQTVLVVHSASAAYGVKGKHTITIRAKVDLPNSCWSNPRFQPPDSNTMPGADGIVPITVIVDSSEGPGIACSMIYQQAVNVPVLHWTSYPAHGLKAIKVIGSRSPVVVTIRRANLGKNPRQSSPTSATPPGTRPWTN